MCQIEPFLHNSHYLALIDKFRDCHSVVSQLYTIFAFEDAWRLLLAWICEFDTV
jgi:hypothetical protein